MSVWVRHGEKGIRVNSGGPNGWAPWEINEMHSQIRYWYSQGLSDLEVAMHVGVSDKTVWRYRHKHGLPTHFPQQRKA